MRNSYNFILNFVPRIIVVLILFTMDCTNANAENVYRCADQSKCGNVQPGSGTCNSYTIGRGTSDGVSSNGLSCSATLCTAGVWYCSDSANGACAVYDCTECSTSLNLFCSTHNYSLLEVNGNIATGTPCDYIKGNTSEALVVHGCALSSCRAGYYKSAGKACDLSNNFQGSGTNISGGGSGIIRPTLFNSNVCCQCPQNSTSPGNNTGGKDSCKCLSGYYGNPGKGVACVKCPDNYISEEGATKISECYHNLTADDDTGYFEYTDKCYYPNK